MKEHRFYVCITASAILVLLFGGCTRAERIETAGDLAKALQREGLAYATQEPASLPDMKYGRIDEGVTLAASGLSVDIIRIEDKRTYKAFLGMGALLVAAERKTGERLPGRPDIYSRRPFIVVVREEPNPGDVKRALNAVLGSE